MARGCRDQFCDLVLTPAAILRLQLAQSQRTPANHHFRASCKLEVVTCTCDRLAINRRFPKPPLWIQLICYSDSQNLEQHLTHLTFSNRPSVYHKGLKSGTARCKRCTGPGTKKDPEHPSPLSAPCFSNVHMPINPENLNGACPLGFTQASLYRHD